MFSNTPRSFVFRFEFWPQRLVQAQRDVGVFRRVFGRALHVHGRERNLLGAFAGDVFVVNGFVA